MSHQLPIVTARRYLDGPAALARPASPAVRGRLADLAVRSSMGSSPASATPNRWRTSPRSNDPDVETAELVGRRRTAAASGPDRRAVTGPRRRRRPAGRARRRRRRRCLLASCSTGNDAAVYGGSFTFVSPGGQDRVLLPGRRTRHRRRPVRPEPGRRRHAGAVRLRGQGRGAELLGFLVRALPGRGARARAGRRRAGARTGCSSSGINVKDTKAAGADFLTSKQVAYPSIYDPSMRTLLSIRGYPASGHPVDDRARPAGPGGAHLAGGDHRPRAADRHGVGRSPPEQA